MVNFIKQKTTNISRVKNLKKLCRVTQVVRVRGVPPGEKLSEPDLAGRQYVRRGRLRHDAQRHHRQAGTHRDE